jgi:hypothetical protein
VEVKENYYWRDRAQRNLEGWCQGEVEELTLDRKRNNAPSKKGGKEERRDSNKDKFTGKEWKVDTSQPLFPLGW